jgi:hypothetical protein
MHLRREEMRINGKTLPKIMLLLFSVAFATAPMASDGNSSKASPQKFVGTFYGESSRTITYHSDGTMSLVDANMFSDDPNLLTAGRRTTPFQGVWKKVGHNSIRVTTLNFATEIAGHNYISDGFTLKTSWTAVYDAPVNGSSPGYTATEVTVEGFAVGANPITGESVFVLSLPDTRADRLYVQ